MIEIAHLLEEPAELSAHRAKYPAGKWDVAAFNSVRLLVKRQLNLEQGGLCVYCEVELAEEGGHVEHIRSKGRNPGLTFVYENLAHSCDGPRHCGHRKRRQTLPIEPRSGCNRCFAMSMIDGRLEPANGLSGLEAQQASDTVSILGLNDASLSWRRKGYADVVLHLPAEDRASFLRTSPFRWTLRGI